MPPAPALCTILKFSTPNLTVQEQPGDMSVRVADSGNSQADLKELLIFLEMFYPPKRIQLARKFKDHPFQSSFYFRDTPTPFYSWRQQCASGQHQGFLGPLPWDPAPKKYSGVWVQSKVQTVHLEGLQSRVSLPCMLWQKLVCITGPHIQKTQTL